MDIKKIDNDFTDTEADKLNTFVANGCIGLESLAKDEVRINSMFGLYMAGKTYTEISKITKTKKDLVLYMAAKMKWYDNRIEYLTDIQREMTSKLLNTRVESLNFITSLIGAHHKYYGDEVNEFLRTGDKTIMEDMDLKSLGQYFKSIEILERIINPSNVGGKGSGATININAAGSQIKQVDEKTLEINPGTTGDILKALSDMKDKQKEEENKE